MKGWDVFLVGLFVSLFMLPVCLDQVAQRYQFSPQLLQAIISVESAGSSRAVHHNHDGSWDIGLMQINSRWWAGRAPPQALLEPCTNLEWGASILAQARAQVGSRWQAVGRYHGGTSREQLRYMRAVFAAWRRLSPGQLAAN